MTPRQRAKWQKRGLELFIVLGVVLELYLLKRGVA